MNNEQRLFIFRRDLRLNDNTALLAALNESQRHKVIPLFIIDPFIMSKMGENKHIITFLRQALKSLDEELREHNSQLNLIEGVPHQVVKKIIQKHNVKSVFVNEDYTPYTQQRDKKIEQICTRKGLSFKSFRDLLLMDPENIFTSSNSPYQIFTYFYKKCKKIGVVDYPQKNKHHNYAQSKLDLCKPITKFKSLDKKNISTRITGSRKACDEILESLSKYTNYEIERDYPALDATTHLSAYLKFGICSPREVYHQIKKQLGTEHPLIRQLFWREFYIYIAHHYPHVFKHAFHRKYDQMVWSENKENLQAWKEGKTGFPIVDAGMRELAETGYMHNRIRMVVASFLVKDLHVNWREGEEHFRNYLVDWDLSINNGNWQWSASTGCDAQPYFRIFNPWSQQKKYDKECRYIKKWVNELQTLEPRIIHNWFKNYQEHTKKTQYPAPIVEHKPESKKAKEEYKRVS